MDYNTSDHYGNIKISDEVLATIASLTVTDVKGVSRLTSKFSTDFKNMLSSKSSANKGVKIEIRDQQVYVDISIVIRYGFKISEVAKQIQYEVMNAITSMTGLSVACVNVNVESVDFEEPAKEKADEAPQAEPEAETAAGIEAIVDDAAADQDPDQASQEQ